MRLFLLACSKNKFTKNIRSQVALKWKAEHEFEQKYDTY